MLLRTEVYRTHGDLQDRKSTRLNSSHSQISYAVFCLKKKKAQIAEINTDLQGFKIIHPPPPTLMNHRDSAIDKLSQLMDIRISTDRTNIAMVYTPMDI